MSRSDHDPLAAATDAVRRQLDREEGCSSEEKAALADEFAMLRRVLGKLEARRIEIALFGEIDVGKSALINALLGRRVAEVDVRGGWTKSVAATPWPQMSETEPSGFQVDLLDTPGINEVDSPERIAAAREAARRAELVIFVADGDLNQAEYSVLAALAAAHKPILFVLNKIDLYTAAERSRLRQVLLSERLASVLDEANFLAAAADPQLREFVIEEPGGRVHSEYRKPAPEVGELPERIDEILRREGSRLSALSASLAAADAADRITSAKLRIRDQKANQLIFGFAAGKGATAALTPGIVDLIGGAGVDVAMIVALSKFYGTPLTKRHAGRLAWAIAQAAGWAAAAQGLTFAAFKLFTLHAGTALTAIPQAAAASYGSYIVGHAAKYYFEHGGSWGPGGPKQVVQQILDSTDRDSVLAKFKDEIRRRLDGNPHGKRK